MTPLPTGAQAPGRAWLSRLFRTALGPYVAILRSPGTVAMVTTGMLARLDIAMVYLGIILLVSAGGGSYSVATALTGAHALASAVFAPQLSKLADRRGQRLLLLWLSSVHLPAMLCLVVAVLHDAPVGLQIALSAVGGATNPTVPSMVRVRWSALLRGTPALRTAYAMESTIDAGLIACGAPLATALAALFLPAAPLVIASVTVTISAVSLALQRGTEPPATRASGDRRAREGTLVPPRIPEILPVFLFAGVWLGSFEVATIAVAIDSGRPQSGGLVLALAAIGSMVGGIVVGRLGARLSTGRLLHGALGMLTIAVALMMFTETTTYRLAVGFLAGLAVAPTIITAGTLANSMTPPQRLTEAVAWTGSALVTGTAIGHLLAGATVDRWNGNAGYGVSVWGGACGVLAFSIMVALGRRRAGAVDHTIPARKANDTSSARSRA
ncbi:MFS transporter [Micromonospora sp. NPDC051141]|uniref:MFS transporter n=1 Tax=Micromonospora sp. NPDC051141 TaxID=3364284 RepID=UPI0037B92709